jgi:2-methylcitrate dehydratase PrpD
LLNAGGQLALAALRPAALDDIARDTLSWTGDLANFASRVRVEADASLDALYPGRWPARLTVRTADTVHEIPVDDSPGDPSHRFTMTDLEDKARRMLGTHPDIGLVDTGRRAIEDDAALETLSGYFLGRPRRASGDPASGP